MNLPGKQFIIASRKPHALSVGMNAKSDYILSSDFGDKRTNGFLRSSKLETIPRATGPRKFIRQFFNKYFWRQHPETALRYLPVVSEIRRANLTYSKILEIGSGSLGIIPFLKKPIVGVDVDFSGPKTNLLEKVKASADDLPFKKNTFDASISVDVLEHLSQERREKAIFEMLRVTYKMAIIVVPEGEDSEKQDRQLQQLYSKVFSKTNQFLDEHVNFGLPRKEQVLVAIDKSARKLGKCYRRVFVIEFERQS